MIPVLDDFYLINNNASVSVLLDLQWFAPEDEGKTEEATEHKLKKARDEGRIPKSSDLNSTLV
ncbi:MAG TPA: EscU/YscU/HrcU family type III secretion system export apparatus switch protein, partial [Treponemataceae bacterium]|nr:EscU/YscU/HrcU family type III secretion system export apparatus switch protein [Treponemataceae bacterium]